MMLSFEMVDYPRSFPARFNLKYAGVGSGVFSVYQYCYVDGFVIIQSFMWKTLITFPMSIYLSFVILNKRTNVIGARYF